MTDGASSRIGLKSSSPFSMSVTHAVTITRGEGTDKQSYTVPVESIGKGKAKQFYIRPGDVIFVPRRVF